MVDAILYFGIRVLVSCTRCGNMVAHVT